MQTIVIVGAGFSGTVLAVNLLRRPSTGSLCVVLAERGPAMSRGIAYAQRPHPYLLNVPAARSSADSSDAKQFLRFAQAHLPEADGEDFLPRAMYGDYLQQLLGNAECEAPPQVRFERVMQEVHEIQRDSSGALNVRFAERPPLRADKVVLAVGNPRAAPQPWSEELRAHGLFRDDPWELPQDLDHHQAVLIVGNGLTMVDAALTLAREPNRMPTIFTVSRRGLVPQAQTKFRPSIVRSGEELLTDSSISSMRRMLRASRALARDVEALGGDWREAVTLIRHLAPKIWGRLPHRERARFVRHVQAHWDVHRHRLPPQLAQRLGDLRALGRLKVHAGRIQSATVQAGRARVTWQRRGSNQLTSVRVDLVVNATGPDYSLEHTREPLIQSLRDRGLLTADPLRLGIRTGSFGACQDHTGRISRDLFYLGPMLRAGHWEATAAAELRRHAEQLAQYLTAPTRDAASIDPAL